MKDLSNLLVLFTDIWEKKNLFYLLFSIWLVSKILDIVYIARTTPPSLNLHKKKSPMLNIYICSYQIFLEYRPFHLWYGLLGTGSTEWEHTTATKQLARRRINKKSSTCHLSVYTRINSFDKPWSATIISSYRLLSLCVKTTKMLDTWVEQWHSSSQRTRRCTQCLWTRRSRAPSESCNTYNKRDLWYEHAPCHPTHKIDTNDTHVD